MRLENIKEVNVKEKRTKDKALPSSNESSEGGGITSKRSCEVEAKQGNVKCVLKGTWRCFQMFM